jgi:hypothetical protein
VGCSALGLSLDGPALVDSDADLTDSGTDGALAVEPGEEAPAGSIEAAATTGRAATGVDRNASLAEGAAAPAVTVPTIGRIESDSGRTAADEVAVEVAAAEATGLEGEPSATSRLILRKVGFIFGGCELAVVVEPVAAGRSEEEGPAVPTGRLLGGWWAPEQSRREDERGSVRCAHCSCRSRRPPAGAPLTG